MATGFATLNLGIRNQFASNPLHERSPKIFCEILLNPSKQVIFK
jgi:hypothetical protein